MQQKIQLIASLMHDPDLVILDEPFQGLDPVNAEMVRAGLARVLTLAPDQAHAAEFVSLEDEARASGRGLWGIG